MPDYSETLVFSGALVKRWNDSLMPKRCPREARSLRQPHSAYNGRAICMAQRGRGDYKEPWIKKQGTIQQ